METKRMNRLLVSTFCVLLSVTAAAWAAEGPAPAPAPAAPAAPAAGTGAAAPSDSLPLLRNTSVSIPWQELRDLLDAARKPEAERPPVSYVYSPAVYAATVGAPAAGTAAGGAATVTVVARCEVDVLADKWALVPLGTASNGLRLVTVDGKPCPVVVKDGSLSALLTGKGTRKLEITLEEKVVTDKGVDRFELPLIPSPIVTLTTTIPRKGLDVASSTAAGVKAEEKGEQTIVVSSHRGGSAAVLSWQARPVRPAAMPTRLYADIETLVSLDDGLARLTSDVRLQVLHTPVDKIRLAVDPKATVLAVTGDGVAGWNLADEKGAKFVEVSFLPPAAGDKTLKVTCERELAEAGGELAIQAVRVDGAKRDRGEIAVASRGGWEVKPVAGAVPAAAPAAAPAAPAAPAAASTAAERVGVSRLSASLRSAGGAGLELAYVYREAPATVTLAVARPKRLPPRIYANTATLVTVEGGRLRCRAEVTYDILHTGVDILRVDLPDGVELLGVTAPSLRHTQVVTEGKKRTLVADLKDVALGAYVLTLTYELRLKDDATAPVVPLISHGEAAQDRGSVALEVRGGLEVQATAKAAERMDVKELTGELWGRASSPLIMAFKYAKPPAELTLAITRHKDLSVLVAMSDVCEAATTVTPDGKSITKMMFVVRNNLKQFMTLRLPEGAEVWSAFVNDRPVTPVRTAAGDVLVPLVKSQLEDNDADNDDEDARTTYIQRRDKRRREETGRADMAKQHVLRDRIKKVQRAEDGPLDLKPYDVEIVFVTPKVKLEDRGDLKLSLPKCDIPTGHLAWAVLLPTGLRVVDSTGNMKEVSSFSLPFRHFADAEYARRGVALAQAQAQEKMAQQAQELAKAMDAMEQVAAAAKAQGVLPVRVEIPFTGTMTRYEKFLVVDEAPEMTVTYRKKTE
jgi:hypothetical protein